ncbi:DUF805 domain-containing protein [Flavobacterium sp. NPDC079362]|uniref:DUF805 domain-containing protein n=1 Tax=Flavobacterium sp. NPDC079362 TaxID=3390566 RepID=UPI003D00748B
MNLIIVLFLGVIDRTLDLTLVQAETGAFGLAYNFAVFLPGLAVSVRRLHDIGKSGWWLLILQVLLVSAIFFSFGALLYGK